MLFIKKKIVLVLIGTANCIKKQSVKYLISSGASKKVIKAEHLKQSVESVQLMQNYEFIIKYIEVLIFMLLIVVFLGLIINLVEKYNKLVLANSEVDTLAGVGGEGEEEEEPVNNIILKIIILLLIILFFLVPLLSPKRNQKQIYTENVPISNFIFMTRRQKKIMFNLMPGSKLEISFLYKQKGQKALNFCYSFKKAEIGETKNLKGEDLALIFQINILERFLLPKQKTTTVYNAIKLNLKNENEEEVIYKHFLTPRLAGLAIPSEKSIEGTYSCRCEDVEKKIYYYKIEGFSIPLEQNRADILMNELIPEEGTSLNISGAIEGITYDFGLEYIGKTLKSKKKIISLIETIE
uniref:Uncharacterized protein n=1 Tax=Pseudochlorodesmis sp. HV01306c TaxID=2358490 RepID=A0A386AYG0_9CHLO|nr:hypothetical protein [Pseudochlorodesmis sp. HV01306c]